MLHEMNMVLVIEHGNELELTLPRHLSTYVAAPYHAKHGFVVLALPLNAS